MQYNTQRDKLVMPEYGRAVQQMVMHAVSLPQRDKRQECASTIVDIMANMYPSLRELPNYREHLWNHIAYMSGYTLDVDYPYPLTRLDGEAKRPAPLHYPMKRIRNRYYGNLVEQHLAHLAEMPEGEERDDFLALVANQMKQTLFDWNRDAMDEEKIAADILRYTDGRVRLDLSAFRFDAVMQGKQQTNGSKKKKKK